MNNQWFMNNYDIAEKIYPESMTGVLTADIYIRALSVDSALGSINYAKPISFADFNNIFGCIDADIVEAKMSYIYEAKGMSSYKNMIKDAADTNRRLFGGYYNKLINEGIFTAENCDSHLLNYQDIEEDFDYTIWGCDKNDGIYNYSTGVTADVGFRIFFDIIKAASIP